jgi:FKBP-type peptidyl-prolyl cis-trans isomerase (trigger factor)
MSLEIKQLPKSEIEIAGEMPAEEFSKFWQKAVNELSKNISIPGFRPGKIPEKVLIEKAGEGAVLDNAAELALRDIYPRILQEKKIEAIGHPRAAITKITKGGPLGFKFQTAVLPAIKMPEDYKEIAAEIAKNKEEIIVEEKEVDVAIEYLKKKGKEITDELKNTIRKNLQVEKEFKHKEKKRLEALDAILKKSELEVPDVLLEAEKSKMLSEFKNNISNMGLKWEDYLAHIKKKEEELLAGWAEDALRRVKYGLLLRQLDQELGIKVSEEDIEDKIKEFSIRGDVDKDKIKEYAYGIIRNDKIFKLLESC